MPADERVSPRAAIRTWLQDTVIEPRLIPQNDQLKSSEQCDRWKRHRRRKNVSDSRRSRSPRIAPRHDKGKSGEEGSKFDVHRASSIPKQHTSGGSEGINLAERLGLHAPFRTFRDHSRSEVELNNLPRRPKRRRRESSPYSPLEPAETNDAAEFNHAVVSPTGVSRSRKKARRHAENEPENLSGNSLNSTMTLPSPKRPTKSYERRPRHKTREDRYDLKEHKDTKKKERSSKKDGAERKPKSRKRKDKSGAALMHDFAPQNVSNDRLTLQPPKSLGFLGNGRASSPIRRQGLPDLSFSEMKFLNSRQAKPAEPVNHRSNQPTKKMTRRKSEKVADTEAEISRYFISTVPSQSQGAHRRQQKQKESAKKTRILDAPPPFIDLPNTPFLGFGSSGANSASPVKRLSSPALRDLEEKLGRSSRHSSSYLTWSDSGAQSKSSKHSQEDTVTPLKPLGLRSQNAGSLGSRGTPTLRPPNSFPDVNKALFGGGGTITSLAPEKTPTVKSGHGAGRSPQMAIRQPGKRFVADERQEIEQAKVNGKGGAQCPKEDAAPVNQIFPSSNRAQNSPRVLEFQNTTSSPSLVTAPKNQSFNGPLHDALETLLGELKAGRTVGVQQTPVPQATSDHARNSEALVTDNTARAPNASSRGSTGHQPPSASSKDSTSVPSRDNRRPDSRRLAMSPLLRNTVALLGPPPNTIVSKTPASHDSRGDAKNAWVGYDSVYERQQSLEYPATFDDGGYAVNHYHGDADEDSPNRPGHNQSEPYDLRPSYHGFQDANDNEIAGKNFDEDCEDWPGDDNLDEFEASNGYNEWDNLRGNQYAEYEHEQDISPGQQPFAPCEESQQDCTLRTDRIEKYNIGNMQENSDDPALARFWTPHKLY